jgi:membrane protease YdiL (CAAX protease family)
MDIHLNTKRILIFLAFAFGIPWTVALALYLTVGATDLLKAGMLANIIFVTAPAVANVATRLITKEGREHLWLWPKFRRGWRFYLAAILLPFLATVVAGITFYLIFPGSFDPDLGEVRKYYAAYSVAPETNPWVALGYITLVASITWLFINGLVSIGEEFGWRAYLLPKLMTRFTGGEPGSLYAAGARKAAVLVGLIWGVWHWPLYLMTLSLTPDFPLLYLLVYPVSTICMSVLLCWVTLRSGSVWPASIGHGFINGTSALSTMPLKGPANMLIGPGPGGIIGMLGYLALALVLYFNRKAFSGTASPGEKETRSEREPAVAGVQ